MIILRLEYLINHAAQNIEKAKRLPANLNLQTIILQADNIKIGYTTKKWFANLYTIIKPGREPKTLQTRSTK